MRKTEGFIMRSALLLMLLLVAFVPACAQRKDRTADLLDGVLSGMAVDGTLDYIANAYIPSAKKLNRKPPYHTNQAYYDHSIREAGNMVLPVNGYVTSGFGYRPSFGRMHKGIDLHLQVGDTVRSALDGVVSRVSVDPHGYGLFVVIQHGGELETRYGHLSNALVIPGEQVFAGEAIGLGGNSGNSTGPHLHFETRQGGEAFDPTYMFNFARAAGIAPNKSLARIDAQNPSTSVMELVSLVTSSESTGKRSQKMKQGKGTYVVKAGDTVSSIASKAGISTLTLCRLNMLSTTDDLKPGTMLRLR